MIKKNRLSEINLQRHLQNCADTIKNWVTGMEYTLEIARDMFESVIFSEYSLQKKTLIKIITMNFSLTSNDNMDNVSETSVPITYILIIYVRFQLYFIRKKHLLILSF